MFAEKIEIVLLKRKMTKVELAKKMGISPNTMYGKFANDNFRARDLEKIAIILNCDLDFAFVLRDTKEHIS